MKKLAVLFPGIGYTCDKPLLYYSWKVLKKLDYEVFPVPYTGFPDGVKGDLCSWDPAFPHRDSSDVLYAVCHDAFGLVLQQALCRLLFPLPQVKLKALMLI